MPIFELSEVFQSKVMCENLVRIGWAFQELLCPQTNMQKKKKKQVKPLGFDPPEGAYNNQKHLKIWEYALFSG